jgi:hypothetical protein
VIVIDRKLLARYRLGGPCWYCGRWQERLEPHHLWTRGMGGGGRLDIPENLIPLCSSCHREAQAYRIPRCDLVAIVAARLGLRQDEVEERIRELRRAEK